MSATFLEGGGEMGALMRATDWTQTPLGPVDQWPQSLRTTVSTCLNSRFPILIWWGPQLVKLYNDAYREVIAGKHPHALGRPGQEVWPEIWDIIGPMLASVVEQGRSTWSEDQFLPLLRRGFSEECYFTFAYSPIRDESGGIGGVFSVVAETTGRVIGERRLRMLQTLAADGAGDTALEVCQRAVAVLGRNASDVPFALIYLRDDSGTAVRLAAATGSLDPSLAPALVDLTSGDDDRSPWPIGRAVRSGTMVLANAGDMTRAFVAPVIGSQGLPVGVLVAGVSPMLPVDEQYTGFAALIAREIGSSIARARALEDERRRVEALAEIDRAKTAFFSNVSHEFRTPLTLMLSPVEEALSSPKPALDGDELATVHRNAIRLLKLVNTLLDFAQIEAGRARASFEATDLPQLTADLASTFRSAVERAGLRLEVDCPPLPHLVPVDRDGWEKIVLNLLSNALKFTFEGGIAVSLHPHGAAVQLQVRDTGVGIPADELPRLFDRFHRVRGTRSRTHEGSGIGLALVSELVKMHGGTVRAESPVGGGTVFTVTIPATLAASGEPLRSPHPRPSSSFASNPYVTEALRWLPSPPTATEDSATIDHMPARATILLADDNADMREYVTRLLADRWRVEAVADGSAALAAARAHAPALVIADVMMPGLDGFALLRALRAEPGTRAIPVILLSARAGEEASIEGLAAGADDYVVKPFSARELRARVEAQLFRAEVGAIQAAHDRRLADIFRHAPVAVAILRGPDHEVEYANDEYLRVIGHRPILGRPLRDAVPELCDQGIGQLLDQVYSTGQPYAADSLAVTLNRGRQGEPEQAFFNFVYQPMLDRAGHVDGIAVVAADVSELARARHDAESANRAKDQFLAMLAHELRNPLAPILTAVELLDRKGPPDPGLSRLRQTIARQARQLLHLVEDLLDVGRIISGKLRLEKSRVELTAIVHQAVEASSPFVQGRGHTMAVHVPDAPVHVDADGGRITQVICNLLNNAAKYMPRAGRIELSVVEAAGMAWIRVRDQGVGIPREMLERVFDRFVQVGDATDTAYEGGLGIGLFVVRTIIELHGGSVAAASDGPGQGSEFTVALPVASAVVSSTVTVP